MKSNSVSLTHRIAQIDCVNLVGNSQHINASHGKLSDSDFCFTFHRQTQKISSILPTSLSVFGGSDEAR